MIDNFFVQNRFVNTRMANTKMFKLSIFIYKTTGYLTKYVELAQKEFLSTNMNRIFKMYIVESNKKEIMDLSFESYLSLTISLWQANRELTRPFKVNSVYRIRFKFWLISFLKRNNIM